jgi:glucan phosphorylase
MPVFVPRPLPKGLEALTELALDLRWTWSHGTYTLWQMLDADGRQLAVYPYNEPSTLPIQSVRTASGGWLHVPLNLPGRRLMLRVWQVNVGRVQLYLLDSNDPLNSPRDWLNIIRNSMMKLAPQFSSNRMAQEYVEQFYHPAATESEKCRAKQGQLATQLVDWYSTLK